MRVALIVLAVTCLSACGFVGFPGVYRIDVEQGNIVTQEMVDQLKPGMSRRQVRFILGTPLVTDTFDLNRWDYIYVKRNGDDILDQSHMSVFFDGETLLGVEGDSLPTGWRGGDTTPTDEVEEAEAPEDAPLS